MRATEIYQNETGNKVPDNQIAYQEWYLEYVVWLEKQIEANYLLKKEELEVKWETLRGKGLDNKLKKW